MLKVCNFCTTAPQLKIFQVSQMHQPLVGQTDCPAETHAIGCGKDAILFK